jgi:hypothetical protein
MNIEIIGNALHVGDTALPLHEVGREAEVTVWQVPVEYRENGLFVAVTERGAPEEVPACASEQAALLGRLQLEPSGQSQLAEAKAQKLSAINQACDASIAELATHYPEYEVSSWPQQVKEAERYLVDPAETAPLLTAIAQARAIDVAELATRVMVKMEAYAAASGAIIGHRQALEGQLSAATDLEQVEAVAW